MTEFDSNILIYDAEAFEELSDKQKELLRDKTNSQVAYSEKDLSKIPDNSKVFLFLSDEQVKKILVRVKDKGCAIGFVAHPKGTHTIAGFSITDHLEDSFEELLNAERVVNSDILLCNDEPVLNYFTVGEITTFLTERSRGKSIFKRISRLFTFFKRLRHVKSGLFTFSAEDKDAFETAATDILVVQHGKNSMVSRLLSEETCANDGLFHTFIFAPRSIIQLIKAYLLKLFLGREQKTNAFSFLGRLKTESLKLTSDHEFNFDLDGEKLKTEEVVFSMEKGLKLIPAKSVEYVEEPKKNHIFKISNLPSGKVKEEVVRKRLPWISHASTEEYKELFTTLRENARPGQNYVVLMTLSVILVTFGLFANSSPVIIGAMILAPLMSPIISLSMGVLRQDKSMIKRSLITVGVGLLIGYFFAVLITIITPIHTMNEEITSRIKPNIIDLGIAVVSGAAGAYAHSREEIARTLAGVAISVALVPPIAVSGIGAAWGDWDVFFGAFLLVLTNLTGMVLAGALTFLFTGYSPFRLARKGVLISFAVVLSISIPLGYGFIQVVKENRIIQSLTHREINDAKIKYVKVNSTNPLRMSLDLIVEDTPTEEELQSIQSKIEEVIGQEVVLEIGIRLKR